MNRRQILFFFFLFSNILVGYSQSLFPNEFDLDGDERFPSVTSDGKTLLFARENNEGFSFLLSNKLDGKFMPPTTLELSEDLPYTTAPIISYNGRWIYFSAKGKKSGSDIYRMKRWGRRLGKPQKLKGAVNTEGYEMYPSLTKDGNGLYFTRLENNSDPTNLKFAIYYSTLNKDDEWSEPIRLPEGINLYSDKEPRIMPDDKTLLFASKISETSFDYDVMITRKVNDSTWSDPEPVLAINQSKLNHPPCIDGTNQKAYYSNQGKLYEIPLNKVLKNEVEEVVKIAQSRNSVQDQKTEKTESKETPKTAKPSISSFSDLGFDIKEFVTPPKYKAIIIGINTYKDGKIASLDNPEKDANSLSEILTTYYSFEKEDVHLLLSPSREMLIEKFDEVMEKSTEKDHILIFYAGHGHWNSRRKTGYWLPSDAKAKSTANWVRNSTIKEYVASFRAKHVLLISDACFSGSIFKSRGAAFDDADKAIKSLESLPSRKAMTSGTLKEVPDESVFVKYLQKRLVNNQEKYISARGLFDSFRVAVMNNSENVPQFGVINQTGDEGGDFIFMKR